MSIHRYAQPSIKRYLTEHGVLPPYLERNPRRDYIERVVRATPPGITPSSFRSHLVRRAWLSRLNGEPYVLDHIVPLNHPYICGLNVPANIAVIPARCNAAKSNSFAPGQFCLFEDHGQLNMRFT